MIHVPPLRSELLASTALTPTHHKGGGAIIGLVVAIAIPFAAPAIAGAIGLSAAVGSVALGSAIVGGVLGAAVAGITGGNVLLGGLGGTFGGFAGGGGFSGIGGQTAATLGGSAGDFAGLSAAQLGGTASTAANVGAGLTTSFDAVTGAGATFDAFGNVNPLATSTDVFSPVSSSFTNFNAPQVADSGGVLTGGSGADTFQPFDTGTGAGAQFDAFGNVNPAFSPGSPAGPATVIGPGQSSFVADAADAGTNFARGQGVGSNAATGGIPATNAASRPVSLSDRISGGFDSLKTSAGNAITNALKPEKLIESGGKFALSKLSEAFADEVPVSREEEARLAFLDQSRAEQARLQGQKEEISNQFLAQASAISPLQRGQEAFALANNRFNRGADTILRKGAQGRSSGATFSLERKLNLEKSRAGLSAFQRGETAGRADQDSKIAAASATLPNGAAIASGAAADLAAADKRFLRLQQEQKNFGSVFGGIFANNNVDTDEERKARGA